MLNLRGRNKAKKHSAGEALDEQENKSLVIETEMDRLRINEEEEEEEAEAEAEGRKRGDRGKSKRASLQKSREDALHQKAFSFLLERRASVEHQEEETDVDAIPLPRQEKAVKLQPSLRNGNETLAAVSEGRSAIRANQRPPGGSITERRGMLNLPGDGKLFADVEDVREEETAQM
ncbi:hypothetical protein ILYODFUR_015677 [Ilyodon furcidens]|uniref:Uncharacterized protein n=1 Tax=Ilyodon furcidens TaxID=33524 RepID=A0ABV0V3C5_9TELE